MDNEPEPTYAPPTSDKVGHSRTSTDAGRQSPTTSDQSRDEHTLTTKEATELFERKGFPRSQRSMERYCKSGELDCVVDPDEERYYITMASIDRVIGKLKEFKARHAQVATHDPDMATGDDAGPSRSSSDGIESSEGNEDHSNMRFKEIEYKLRDAEIGSRAKDLYIERLNTERERFLNQLIEGSREIGILETKLRQLEAPRQNQDSYEKGEVEKEAGDPQATEAEELHQRELNPPD